jgi:hypothetical protein
LPPAEPASASEADRDAARRLDGSSNRWYLDPLFRGRYPEDAIADRVRRGHLQGPDLPFVREGDLQAIAEPTDFLGVNYYSRVVVRAGVAGELGAAGVPVAAGDPIAVRVVPKEELTTMGWEVYPQGLYELLVRIDREYRPAKIYLTENGAFPARPSRPVVTAARVLCRTLRHRALVDGVPLRSSSGPSSTTEWSRGTRSDSASSGSITPPSNGFRRTAFCIARRSRERHSRRRAALHPQEASMSSTRSDSARPLRALYGALFAIIALSAAAAAVWAQDTASRPAAVVRVVTDASGSRLQVDGRDFMVFGMNWDYFPIGENYLYDGAADDVIVALGARCRCSATWGSTPSGSTSASRRAGSGTSTSATASTR